MPATLPLRPARRTTGRALVVIVVLVATSACIPLPTETPTPSPSPTATPGPTPTPEPSASAEPTPEPYSLADPSATDPREIQVSVAPNLPTDGSGTITVTVVNHSPSLIRELVLRWSTALDEHLLLAPFTPSSQRTCDGCPPLVQPWTKWVVGPGAQGEPAGTTSLGWGPLLSSGGTLTIPVVTTRRQNGPVSFDLQILAGEALLTLEDGTPAWLRVSVP
jgi:hypothetical protein